MREREAQYEHSGQRNEDDAKDGEGIEMKECLGIEVRCALCAQGKPDAKERDQCDGTGANASQGVGSML